MRDLLLILLLACYGPMAVRYPHVGLYLWTWFAIMNPHKLVYGFARGQSFNFWVAALTVFFWLISKERKIIPLNAFTIFAGLFAVWMTITTILAPTSDLSWPLWDRNIKSFALIYMVAALITTRVRLVAFLWVFMLSIGYFSTQAGLATIVTGGSAVITGPPKSMISDRNHLALAMAITLPIINYLRIQSANNLIRIGLAGLMFLSVAAIIGTFSRGGLISLATVALFMWLKGKHKFIYAAVVLLTFSIGINFVPDSYLERAGTITEATEDTSFQGRLNAWSVAWQTAGDRIFGAGFNGPNQPSNWFKYNQTQPYAAHSIYFMVIGEHGFIGFILYMGMLASAWFALKRLIISEKKSENPQEWATELASALQCSFITFMVGGAALSMSYYDGFLILLVLSANLSSIVRLERGEAASETMAKRQNAFYGPVAPRPAE